jgi:hypothetical protein
MENGNDEVMRQAEPAAGMTCNHRKRILLIFRLSIADGLFFEILIRFGRAALPRRPDIWAKRQLCPTGN